MRPTHRQLHLSMVLLLLAASVVGCSGSGAPAPAVGETPSTAPSRPPLPTAEPGTAEAILDQAAERWDWGGRRAMVDEAGFHIKGRLTSFVRGPGEPGIEGRTEVWTRYSPTGVRMQESLVRTNPSTGEETVLGEKVQMVDGDKSWQSNPGTKTMEPLPSHAIQVATQPSPRRLLLHREYHLTVALKDKAPIAELDGLLAWSIATKDASGNECWAYVDMAGDLRKLTYKAPTGAWVSAVFETFRDGSQKELSRSEKVSYYENGVKTRSYFWLEREANPELPASLFRP